MRRRTAGLLATAGIILVGTLYVMRRDCGGIAGKWNRRTLLHRCATPFQHGPPQRGVVAFEQ